MIRKEPCFFLIKMCYFRELFASSIVRTQTLVKGLSSQRIPSSPKAHGKRSRFHFQSTNFTQFLKAFLVSLHGQSLSTSDIQVVKLRIENRQLNFLCLIISRDLFFSFSRFSVFPLTCIGLVKRPFSLLGFCFLPLTLFFSHSIWLFMVICCLTMCRC